MTYVPTSSRSTNLDSIAVPVTERIAQEYSNQYVGNERERVVAKALTSLESHHDSNNSGKKPYSGSHVSTGDCSRKSWPQGLLRNMVPRSTSNMSD